MQRLDKEPPLEAKAQGVPIGGRATPEPQAPPIPTGRDDQCNIDRRQCNNPLNNIKSNTAHQNLVVLQHQDWNSPTQKKENKIILKITL